MMNFSAWSEEMMENWKQSQQQYWNNISGQAGASGADKTQGAPNLAEGLEQWWALVNPLLPVQSTDVMKRVFEAGKSYTQFLENTFDAENKAANPLENWLSEMEKGFNAWSEQATQSDNNFFQHAPGMNVMQGWQRILESLNSIPEENLRPVADLAEKYREALQTYMGAFSEQGLDSLQALRQRLSEMSDEGVSITSLKELYDIWVDVGEEIYNKFSMSQQHQEIYGELINSFTALKSELDSMLEPQFRSLNIVTQKDLDNVLKQLQQVKHENETLRQQLAELAKRVETLETAPARNTASSPKTASAKPETKKAVADKPAPAPKTPAAKKPAPEKAAAPKAKKETAPPPEAPAAKKPPPTKVATPKAKKEAVPPLKAPAPTSPTKKPAPKAVKAGPDDLTKIKGIGPKMGEKLIDAGIQTFDQLAGLSPDQVETLDKKLNARGRSLRDDWAGQAANLSDTKLV